jgi:hypothetical protein
LKAIDGANNKPSGSLKWKTLDIRTSPKLWSLPMAHALQPKPLATPSCVNVLAILKPQTRGAKFKRKLEALSFPT